MTVDWAEALDRLEEGLAGYRSVAADPDASAPAPFVPPDVDGPPPPELGDRVANLVRELEELGALLEGRKSEISDELRRLPRRAGRPPAGTGESRFETHA